MNKYKISFCTVCRNRLHHLKETLPVNIRDNEQYEAVEFILLDYNSDDGLETYIQQHFQHYIDIGKLVYYRTTEPDSFHRSHARNLAFKLADGELICNLDADNFTGSNFAAYINHAYQEGPDICLSAIGKAKQMKKDVLGRVCIRKELFLQVGGYDEAISTYGFEDYDFINRIEKLGSRRVVIDDPAFLRAIEHSDAERIAEEYYKRHFAALYLYYINPSSTDFLLLLNNMEYLKATMLDLGSLYTDDPANCITPYSYTSQYTLLQKDWVKGKWRMHDQMLYLDEMPLITDGTYYKIEDNVLIEQSIFFCSQLANRSKMEANEINGHIVVNDGLFGAGKVYKNFNYKTPIFI